MIQLVKKTSFMKKVCSSLGIFLLISSSLFSQTVTKTVIVENFDGASFILTGTPSSQWKINTAYNVSPPNSYQGIVPNMLGDSIVLQTQAYDLTGISYVEMQFQHICKISPRDTLRMEYRITGQRWLPIPSWTYLGNATAYANRGFSAASYAEWQQNDSLAIPNNNTWWKEEIFDFSYLVGGESSVEFRFILKRGKTQGTQIAYGWLIDDFKLITAPYMLKKPVVEFLTPFAKDTVYSVGPWKINAKVKTATTANI